MTLKIVSPEQAVIRPATRNPNWSPEEEAKRPPSYEFFGPNSGNDGADIIDVQMLNRSIGRHSHEVDEFQIMLGRPGSLFEGNPIPSLMVHYSDAFALYGPLAGADEPLHLLQLRAEPIDHESAGEWGDYRLPDDRHMMPYVSERHEGAVVPELTEDVQLESGSIISETLIDTDDGVGTSLVTAGPGTVIRVPSPKGSSGQFVYVANGAITYDGETFPEGSIGWQPPVDEQVRLIAGDPGCRVIVMRLPFPATTVTRSQTEKAGSYSQ